MLRVDAMLADAAARGNAPAGTPNVPGIYVTVAYVNRSTLPIADWAIMLRGTAPGTDGAAAAFERAVHLRRVDPADAAERRQVQVSDMPSAGEVTVTIQSVMVDQGGVTWTRRDDGRLTSRRSRRQAKHVRQLIAGQF